MLKYSVALLLDHRDYAKPITKNCSPHFTEYQIFFEFLFSFGNILVRNASKYDFQK
jgi:hypothetical protein